MKLPFNDRFRRLAYGRDVRRRTVRMRLTLLYGGLFLACGAALLAVTYVLVAHAPITEYGRTTIRRGGQRGGHGQGFLATTLPAVHGQHVVATAVRGQRISDLHQLLIWSGIALAIMAIIAAVLGWIVAGRVLRPLRTITTTTREISAHNLHRRLALEGPSDELKDLGDTIDALLARLDGSFQAQRAFVANASHELRTPLALSRATLSFALTDPELTLESLKAAVQDALDAGTDQEQLIEALLSLAQSQQDLEHPQIFDLAEIAHDVIETQQPRASDQRVTIDAAISSAPVSGDPRLARTMLTNLVENALRYNVPHGRVNITLNARGEHTALTVSNTGPEVRADQIDRLLQPFRRLTQDRSNDDGYGLGLSIVVAIANAHGAMLNIQSRAEGGLHITVEFPAVSTGHQNPPAEPAPTPTTAHSRIHR